MIDNIWHLRGVTNLPAEATDSVIIERVEAFLAKQHKLIIEQTDTSIEFSSPLWEDWPTPNWLALLIYDRGKFWIEQGVEGRSLRYDLRSWQGLVFCLGGALMFFVFVSSLQGVVEGGRVALVMFAWLYGANMILAWGRIPLAIRKAVNRS